MRLLNYLTEDIDNLLKNNKLFQLYKENMGNILYRGARRDVYGYEIFKSRTDRKPLDTPTHIHKMFDDLFNKRFGWKARSEGMFATSDKQETGHYGKAYIFIPIEPYKFIYSPNVSDLLNILKYYNSNYGFNDAEIEILGKFFRNEQSPYKQSNDERAIKIIDSKIISDYNDKDIVKAIRSKNEIMFKCNQYILMESKYFEEKYKGKNDEIT